MPKPAPPPVPDPFADPKLADSVLCRAGFGLRPSELPRLRKAGYRRWVEEQIRPDDAADAECARRLSALKLRIKYNAGNGYEAKDEMLPLAFLDQPIEAAWPLTDHKVMMDGAERRRPRDEMTAATILRGVYSRWQLREMLVGFWHDHFNVDAMGNEQVTAALPTYDRDVIRRYALGNFRELMEEVAKSPAMLVYLSNRSSRAGSANENFAREMFELHSLGRDAYLNDKYDHWRDVPGALQGHPRGYIDEDVYEAARAFTGWTLEDGAGIDGRRKLPQTGRFTYVESWHDGYQKRVLAQEFEPFAKAMEDGRKVLDLVAFHPATARAICTKLCRRLVGPAAPKALVEASQAVWTARRDKPDQIAETVKTILLSRDFVQPAQPKVKRPLLLAASFARATEMEFTPTEGLANQIAAAGQRLFGWPTPTGLPDDDQLFVSTNAMRHRWILAFGVAQNAWGNGTLPMPAADVPTEEMATFWFGRLGGAATQQAVMVVAAGLNLMPNPSARWARVAAYAAMAPAFQTA